MCKMWPMLLQVGVIILHDNERPHHKDSVLSVFGQYGWETLSHPLYCPNMSPSDYNLFWKLKELLRESVSVRLKMRPHCAARQHATHCSFAALQKLLGICRQCNLVHMKKEFFANLLQVTKTVERRYMSCPPPKRISRTKSIS